MRVALLFIDGVGIGRPEPSVNPLARVQHLLSQFEGGSGQPLPDRGVLRELETTFGVAGRPQSATNQTALYTGEPAPRLLGRHLLGYPNLALRELLERRSIVRRLTDAGRTASFANAYPFAYLQALGLPHVGGPTEFTIPDRHLRRLKPSASTLAFAAAGVALRTFDDARRDQGLTHDIDGQSPRARALGLPARTSSQAATIFWSLSADFTLFEHFLADEAAHAQDFDAARTALDTFDRFARDVVARRPDDAVVLVTSDHGNAEDLSTRSHTLNRVPLLAFGAEPPVSVETLADVGRWVLELLEVG